MIPPGEGWVLVTVVPVVSLRVFRAWLRRCTRNLSELLLLRFSLTRPQSSSYSAQGERRERWVPTKGAQGEMGRPSPAPLPHQLFLCRVLYEDDWGRVSDFRKCARKCCFCNRNCGCCIKLFLLEK